MHQKKHLAALTAFVLAAALAACGSKPADQQPTDQQPTDVPTEPGVTETAPVSETAAESETETTAAADTDMAELHAALKNTVWSGVNGDDGAFAVGFGEKEITFVTQTGVTTEGYWDAADGKLRICSDEALTQEVRTIPLNFNAEKIVLSLFDKVYMVNTGAESRDAAASEASKLPAAADAYNALKGAYWGGGDSDYALIFMLNDDGSCDMHYYDASDGVINETTFYWGMSSDTICFYNEDFAPVMHFNWSMEGDVFRLRDETTGNNVPCTKLPPEEAAEVSYQLGVLAGAYESEDADGGALPDQDDPYAGYDVAVE